MKRLLACIMSIVLVVGLAPAPASAAGARLQAATGIGAQADIGAADATFKDKNLYDAVIAQLDEQGIAYTADDATNNVKLAAAENARLTRLNLCHRHIHDISGLEAFTALEWIDLSNNLVTTSSQFASMENLAYLDLYDNAVRDLGGLRGLAKLTHLNLGDNDEVSRSAMENLDALSTLTSLTWLDFSRNQTPEVTTHIKDLVNLEHLNLMNNNLKDIYDLAKLTKMRTLILNDNGELAGISTVANMTELEELYASCTHLNMSSVSNGVDRYGADKTGINGLFNDDGSLKLAKLRKIDLLADWNTGFSTDGRNNNAEANAHIQELYRLRKEGSLEFGYYYTWFDIPGHATEMRTANYMHTDPDTGVKYITYDDFDPYCDGVHDDFYAIVNAHAYADFYGCEVRATVGSADSNAAADKTFHIFGYYNTRDFIAYTNVDWQNANFVIHDEHIDHYPARHKQLLLFYTSPAGSKTNTSLYKRMKTLENTDESGKVIRDANGKLASFAMNKPFGTRSTSFAGVNDRFDAALAELAELGYERFYVMLTNENKRQYRRHEGLDDITWEGFAQWDGFIVGADGTIEKLNSSTTLPQGAPSLSSEDYHAPDPMPVQWDFEGITKVRIIPIPAQKSYVKNGHFTTIPLASKGETPRDGGGKPTDYRRCLDFRYCANIELANITQKLGYAESGFDHNELTGSYYGFFTMNYAADVDMHDCTAWDRRAVTSTYGIQLDQIVNIKLTRVSESNPFEHLFDIGGNRWGLTGNNYLKHILYDHCSLSRIDAHMGYYDLTVRDCTLGAGGLCLTGQGPLTVERTETYSRSFMNLRSDYGSTWDGDAHINDCTHHMIRSQEKAHEPQNFTASTARFDDAAQTIRHDFGYPVRHPNLFVRNFTLDERYFSGWTTPYAMTYGIISNYLNGLEKYDDYWPDTVDIDGLNLVNYDEKLGFETHVRMPLYLYGPVKRAFDAGGYSIRNVRYNGSLLQANMDAGEDLELRRDASAPTTSVALPFELVQGSPVERMIGEADIAGRNIVIEYTGDEPDLAFTDSPKYYVSNDHWIVVKPYFVEHRANSEVAYFSAREIARRWTERLAESTEELGGIVRMSVRTAALTLGTADGNAKATDGITQILHMKLLDTHAQHVHEWGAESVTWPATCTVEGSKTIVCAYDASHAKTEEIPALRHAWGAWERLDETSHQRTCSRDASHIEVAAHTWDTGAVTKAATAEEAGVRTFTCTTCAATRTEEIPKLEEHVHTWGEWQVTKVPTCTEAGTRQRVCTLDASHLETEPVDALGHDWGAWTRLDDVSHQRACTRDASHIEAGPHTWDTGAVTKAATADEAGVRTFTCTTCAATRTEEIPKTGGESGGTDPQPGGETPAPTPTPAPGGDPTPAPGGETPAPASPSDIPDPATPSATDPATPSESAAGKPTDIARATIALVRTSYSYDGKAKKPKVARVALGNRTLVQGSDFRVTYSKGRKNVGAYEVTVSGVGAYAGSKSAAFKINPRGAKLLSVTRTGKRGLAVKWKKQATKMSAARIIGYQVLLTTGKKPMKRTRLLVANGFKTASCTTSGLKPNATYTVRVRTYMKSQGAFHYSTWSAPKTVRIS